MSPGPQLPLGRAGWVGTCLRAAPHPALGGRSVHAPPSASPRRWPPTDPHSRLHPAASVDFPERGGDCSRPRVHSGCLGAEAGGTHPTGWERVGHGDPGCCTLRASPVCAFAHVHVSVRAHATGAGWGAPCVMQAPGGSAQGGSQPASSLLSDPPAAASLSVRLRGKLRGEGRVGAGALGQEVTGRGEGQAGVRPSLALGPVAGNQWPPPRG